MNEVTESLPWLQLLLQMNYLISTLVIGYDWQCSARRLFDSKGVTSFAKGFLGWVGWINLKEITMVYDGIVYFVCKKRTWFCSSSKKYLTFRKLWWLCRHKWRAKTLIPMSNINIIIKNKKIQRVPSLTEKDTIMNIFMRNLPSMHDTEASVDKEALKSRDRQYTGHFWGTRPIFTNRIQWTYWCLQRKTKDLVSDATEKVSSVVEDDTLDNTFSEELKATTVDRRRELISRSFRKASTPLLDLLAREKNQFDSSWGHL